MTISGGIATLPIDATDTEGLIKYSDIAVYKAKAAGKNNIVIYSENRRRFIRVDFATDIRVKEVYSKERIDAWETESEDLSTWGILFKCNHGLNPGTEVQLQIPTDLAVEPLLIDGTVVRIEKSSTNQFDMGPHFLI